MKQNILVLLLSVLSITHVTYTAYSLKTIGAGAVLILASASQGALAVDELRDGSALIPERAMGSLVGVGLATMVIMQKNPFPACLLLFAASVGVDTAERFIIQNSSTQEQRIAQLENYYRRGKMHNLARIVGAFVALRWYMSQQSSTDDIATIVCPTASALMLLGAAVGRVVVPQLLDDSCA